MDKIKFYQVRDLGDQINDTYRFMKNHIPSFWKVIFTYILPAQIIIALIAVVLFKDILLMLKDIQNVASDIKPGMDIDEILEVFKPILDNVKDFITNPANIALMTGLTIASLILSIYRSALTYSAISAYNENGDSVTISDLHQRTVGNMGKYFAYTLILMVCIIVFSVLLSLIPILGILALLVGIVYFGVTMTAFFPVVFFEDLGIMDALKRSTKLIGEKHWGKTLLICFALFIASMMLSIVVSSVGAIGNLLGAMGGLVFSQILSTIAFFLFGIFSSMVYCFNYASVRTEKEGFPNQNNDLIDEIGSVK